MVLRNVTRLTAACIVAALAASAAACGQKNAPTAPSSSAPAAQPSGTNASNATISGTVVGVTSASAFKTERVNLTVTVTGTTSMTTIDDNGHFTLTNVPPGHIDLHFTGPGVDAHLALDVAERATIVIVVRVAGNDARLDDNRGDNNQAGVEVNGTINQGSLAGSCAAHNLSFTVGATKIVTNASTLFRDGTCDSLKGGSRVEVKGTRQADGSVLAADIEGDNDADDDDDQNEVELKGTIATGSIAGSCAANSLSFRIGSTVVRTNASTRFKDVACTSLKVGDRLEVKGTRQSDASVLASRVERDDD